MLYFLSSFFPLLRYQTFRGVCAVLLSFAISWLCGEYFIKWLKIQQKSGQPIRDDGPQRHRTEKAGTPTMGGLLILWSVTLTTLLLSNLSIIYVWLILFVMWAYGSIGLLDDLHKLKTNDYHGFSARQKFILQFSISGLVALAIGLLIDCSVYFPLMKNFVIELPLFLFVIWGAVVIVGSTNAVNLTDGLDGLAIFPVMMASFSLAAIAYVVGNAVFSKYLLLPHVPNIGELVIFLGAWMGGSLGFLWYNAPPARIFMGDTGSLAAGASLGATALLIKHEFIWALIGAIFVVEALSVIIQVYYYKRTKKRVFLMAPLHHHFEQKGMQESTIVIRFWIMAVLLSVIGLASLKLR